MRRRAGQAPGVLGIRLAGDTADLDPLADVLAEVPSVEVLSRSAGRPNRYEPGVRVYLTVRITRPGGDRR